MASIFAFFSNYYFIILLFFNNMLPGNLVCLLSPSGQRQKLEIKRCE